MPRAVRQIDGHQSMPIPMFFNGQHLPVGKLQIAVAAFTGRQRFGRFAFERLAIQLLIRLVDENYPVICQTECSAAIFVHPTAHAETHWCQAMGLAITPMPDSTSGVLGTVLVPEQAVLANLQFGKVDTGSDRFGGAEGFSFLR
ncbi:hypothetical protein D9M71_737530 [compost metagenome]